MDAIHTSHEYAFVGDWAGNIIVFNDQIQRLHTFSLITEKETLNSMDVGLNAFYYEDNRLIIGTRGNEVYEYTFNPENGSKKFDHIITQGHYAPSKTWTNEVWGLSVFKNKDEYITCSDDATLRHWSIKEKKMLNVISLNKNMDGNDLEMDPKTKELSDAAKARALDVNDDGKIIAVGFWDGSMKIISTANWKILNEMKVAKEWVSDVKFSPNKKFLAYASHDNKVYIHTVHDMKKKF